MIKIDRYYIVQWKIEPYTLQENKDMKFYETAIKFNLDEIMCDSIF